MPGESGRERIERLEQELAAAKEALVTARDADVTDRQRLAPQFELLFEAAPDGLVITDQAGRMTRVNRKTEQLFGFDRSELIGQPVELLVPERLRGHHAGHRRQFVARTDAHPMGGGSDRQLLALRKDGSEFAAGISLSASIDRDWVIVSIRDATDSIRLIQKLHTIQLSLAQAHKVAEIGTWDWDLVALELTLSDEVYQITGLPHGAPIERFIEQLDPAEFQQLQEEVAAATLSGRPFEANIRIKHVSGDLRIVKCGYVVLKDAKGVPQRLLGSAMDVTDRSRALALLRSSEERYRQIVETAQEGIWAIDSNHRTTFVNATMAAMLGYSAAEMIGMSGLDFFEVEDSDAVRQRIAHRQAGLSERYEVRLKGKNGMRPWVVVSSTPVFDPGGRYAGVFAMITDVTNQKQTQSALHLADRMASVGLMAASVAHEINNPLAVVTCNLALIADRLSAALQQQLDPGQPRLLEDSEAVMAALADAREAAQRVRLVVQDLSMFSRSDQEQRRVIHPLKVLESSVRLVSNEIRHRARLEKQYGSIPAVLANESQLGQVIINLLVNAAQSMPDGQIDRHVLRVVSSTGADGSAIIEIIDNGVGIRAEILPRIFDPFFTTKPVGAGTGLGLSICHRIVAAHGGRLEVESEVGKGSTFRVVLPAASLEPIEAISTVSSEPPLRRGRILIVDDEIQLVQAVRRLLALEHDVTACTSAREALERITGGELFDLVLCDLMMPDMSGMDLHAALERLGGGLAERMIFATGGAFSSAAREFIAQLPNPLLEKPFEAAQLRSLIADRLQLHAARDTSGSRERDPE